MHISMLKQIYTSVFVNSGLKLDIAFESDNLKNHKPKLAVDFDEF